VETVRPTAAAAGTADTDPHRAPGGGRRAAHSRAHPLSHPLAAISGVLGARARHETELHTDDGVLLRARWLRHPEGAAPATVVLVHGFSATQDHRDILALATAAHAAGYDVLTYDARGHGRSGGRCAVGSAEHADVACAAEAAAALAAPVILVGVSMGAVAVANYLGTGTTTAVAGAVLVSGPARWRMRPSPVGLLTAALTRTAPGRWAAARWLRVRIAPRWRTGEAPESTLRRVSLPLAVVHGTGDRLLGSIHGRRLHASAGGPSRLIEVDGMGHGVDERGRAATLEALQWVLEIHGHTPVAAGSPAPADHPGDRQPLAPPPTLAPATDHPAVPAPAGGQLRFSPTTTPAR